MSIDVRNVPKITMITVRSLPIYVLGTISPYPTEVIETIVNQNEFHKKMNFPCTLISYILMSTPNIMVTHNKEINENVNGFYLSTHLIVNIVSALHLCISHKVSALFPEYPL